MTFLTPTLIGLVLLLVGGATALAAAVGFGARPNRRAAIAFVVAGGLAVWGWMLVNR